MLAPARPSTLRRPRWRRVLASRVTWVVASGLLLTALATTVAWRAAQARLDADTEAAIEAEVGRLQARVMAYVALLRATRAYVHTELEAGALDAAGYRAFVTGLRIASDFPGIQGLGWSPLVDPAGPRFTIALLEPLDDRNRAALGFDMHSEPVRAAAMDRARDQGSFAMTGAVVLKQEIYADKSPGFLIYSPLYTGNKVPPTVEGRRAALVGFIYAPFRAQDFFAGLFDGGRVTLQAIRAPRPDGGFELLREMPGEPPAGARVRRMAFGGQPWELVFEPASGLPGADRLAPFLVLGAGLLITVLLFGLALAQSQARRRAEQQGELLQQQVDFAQMLVGIVSHDLRNPVGVIQLNATLLERAGLPEAQARSVRRIQDSAGLGERLIRDLLDFTQARLGGGIPVARARGDLVDIARRAVEQARAGHPGRAIEWRSEGNGQGLWDADRITQVLSNLLGNAISYGRQDAPVSVVLDGRGERVRLSVHNEGAPIPGSLQAALFDPLRRGGSSDGAQGRNIGLGLFIVRQIALAHGGEVECRSAAGEGTTFTVDLPRGPAAGDQMPPAS